MNLPGYEWLKAELMSDEGKREVAIAQELAPIAADLGTTDAEIGAGMVPEESACQHGDHRGVEGRRRLKKTSRRSTCCPS